MCRANRTPPPRRSHCLTYIFISRAHPVRPREYGVRMSADRKQSHAAPTVNWFTDVSLHDCLTDCLSVRVCVCVCFDGGPFAARPGPRLLAGHLICFRTLVRRVYVGFEYHLQAIYHCCRARSCSRMRAVRRVVNSLLKKGCRRRRQRLKISVNGTCDARKRE